MCWLLRALLGDGQTRVPCPVSSHSPPPAWGRASSVPHASAPHAVPKSALVGGPRSLDRKRPASFRGAQSLPAGPGLRGNPQSQCSPHPHPHPVALPVHGVQAQRALPGLSPKRAAPSGRGQPSATAAGPSPAQRSLPSLPAVPHAACGMFCEAAAAFRHLLQSLKLGGRLDVALSHQRVLGSCWLPAGVGQ